MKYLIRSTFFFLLLSLSTSLFSQKIISEGITVDHLQKPLFLLGEDVKTCEVKVNPGLLDIYSVEAFLDDKAPMEKKKFWDFGPMGRGDYPSTWGTLSKSYLSFFGLKPVDYEGDVVVNLRLSDFRILNKKEKQRDIKCKNDSGVVTKCPTYYYEVSHKIFANLKVVDKGGNVLLTKDLSIGKNTIRFGYKTANAISLEELEEKYINEENDFRRKLEGACVLNVFMRAKKAIEQRFAFVHLKHKFYFASGRHKKHSYQDIDETNKAVIKAIRDAEGGNTLYVNQEIEKAVKEYDQILFKARVNADLKRKKRRFKNDNLTVLIYKNIANAYLYLHEYDKAIEWLNKGMAVKKSGSLLSTMSLVKNWQGRDAVAKNVDVIEIGERIMPGELSLSWRNAKKVNYIFNYYEPGVIVDPPDYTNAGETTSNNNERPTNVKRNISKNNGRVTKRPQGPPGSSSKGNKQNGNSGSSDTGDNNTPPPPPPVTKGVLNEYELDKKVVYSSLSEALKHPENVYRLDLSGKNIKSVSPDLLRLTNLQELDLSNNVFLEIPYAVCGLLKLQRLNMEKNNLTGISHLIGNLRNLKVLNLDNNHIKVFPNDFSKLTQIREFTCDVHEITKGELIRLMSLNPRMKPDYKAYHSFEEALKVNPTNVQYLSLIDSKNSTLDDRIFTLINLRKLSVASNDLMIFPAEIGMLSKLESLEITGNIYSLPREVGYITSLKALNIGYSNIKTLPNEIGNLKNLKTLKVKKGQLSNSEIARIKGWIPKIVIELI